MLSDLQNANLKNNFNSNSVSLFNFIYYRYFNEKYSKFMHDKEKFIKKSKNSYLIGTFYKNCYNI